jgi:glutathione S-transferase
MGIKLYGFGISPPVQSVRLMLDRKGLDYKLVKFLPGTHNIAVRSRGFRGSTVPAMRMDGRKLQGSLEIAQAIDAAAPEPPLYPSDPELRGKVEEAERWGDGELQDIPRVIFRWLGKHRPEVMRKIARDIGVPAPGLASRLSSPAVKHMASKVDADERIQEAIASVPVALDHVDELIATGVIGGEEPNAADFQIATSVRALMNIDDLKPVNQDRPATELAMRLLPKFGNGLWAGLLPEEWLAPIRAAARS